MRSTNVWVATVVLVAVSAAAGEVTVSLVSDRQVGAGAAYGLKKIAAALGRRKVADKGDVLIVTGLTAIDARLPTWSTSP